jgi:hypothetical protein
MSKLLWTGLYASVMVASGCAAEGLEDEESSAPSEQVQALVRPPSHGCDLVRCRAGYHCEELKYRAVCVLDKPAGSCDTDDDCRLSANYCGGCNCLALGPGEQEPVCKGEQVACFVNPCLGIEPFCDAGKCVAERGRTF